MRYLKHLIAKQTERAAPAQVRNNAGGYVFQLDAWKRLERWLILGAEGGTYYVTERALTRDNAQSLQECLLRDGERTVQTIVRVSQAGRAPKNDAAIFALAMAAGDVVPATRRAALEALPLVCRTGTHLFQFAEAVEHFRRWGTALRRAVGRWYTAPAVDRVALQAVKYQRRQGWSHRDLLRLSHPVAEDAARSALFRWIVAGAGGLGARELHDSKRDVRRSYEAVDAAALPRIVQGFELAHQARSAAEVARLVRDYQLPQECVPNDWKDSREVWAALLPHMGLTAMLRGLGKLTAGGVLSPLSAEVAHVVASLRDGARLRRERVHPLSVLVALKVYGQGHGDKGQLRWKPVPQVLDALDEAFYRSFEAVEPTGKAHLLAVDVSGSMTAPIGNLCLSCREAAGALAMVTARTEASWHVMGFTDKLEALGVSPKMRLDQVTKALYRSNFGSTDCSLPMEWALQNKVPVDVFVVLTDNETYAGRRHPHVALEEYRQRLGRPAKLVVVGMTASGFSIADPKDVGMLDVVGFDTAAPAVMADFARN